MGNSSYNALQVQVTRHFKGGLAILGAYTFSKTIGMADNALDAENIADQYNRRLDRSIINYDYPHFAKMTWIYELPIGPGQGSAGRRSGGTASSAAGS